MRTLAKSMAGLGLALLMAMMPAHVSAQNLPDREELVTFTEAYVEIGEVRAEMSAELEAAESAEEADALQQEANERMMAVLDEKDMTVERYGAITNILNTNEELRAQFEEIYQEIVNGGTL
jgi:uncharacterized protein YggE